MFRSNKQPPSPLNHFPDRDTVRPNYYYRPQTTGYQGPRQPASSRRSSSNSPLATIAIIVVVLVGSFALIKFWSHADAVQTMSNEQAPSSEPTTEEKQPEAADVPAKPAKTTTTDEQMATAINAAIAAHQSVTTSVTVIDITSGTPYYYGTAKETPYVAASVGKLITAAMYLHLVDTGERSLTQTIRDASASELLTRMLEQSDNAAWDALNTNLTWNGLAAYTTSIGANTYKPADNTIAPYQIAELLAKLYSKKLLSAESTQFMLDRMKNANRTQDIKAAVPQNVTVYHKAGWLEDREHDTAIIDDGYDPYVLVIFTKSDPGISVSTRNDTIQQITKATVDRFVGTIQGSSSQ